MVPSMDDFQAHGLVDVDIDPATPSASPMVIVHASALHMTSTPSIDWLSGWARIQPTPEYPTLIDVTPGRVVRWHFCPQGDPVSALYFRRQAQVKALDTVPNASRMANASSSFAHDGLTPEGDFRRRYRPPADIVAWWEDSWGLWFVILAERAQYHTFLETWADIVGPGWPLQAKEAHVSGTVRNGVSSSERWANACELLAAAVVCLQALHDRHISLNWCHPSCFVMLCGSVVAHRLWDATALPGLALGNLLTPALANSLLFTRDPIHHSSCNLSEAYVFRHLRYLAPEAAISRRVSPSNDIYGWGVFAYELITGTTIDGGPDAPDLTDVDILADVHRHVTNEVTHPAEYLEQLAEETSMDLPPKQLSDIIMLALAKDPEDRYHSLDPLAYDLRKLSQICRAGGDLSKFNVGEIDRMSRFNLPQHVIERGPELELLDNSFEAVSDGQASSRIINVWGQSGTGKSRLINDWANNLESSDHGNKCLVGWAKVDEHVKKPLTSFVQIIQSLLDRVLTDSRESAKEWLERIRKALGTQWGLFVSLLSPDCRRLINEDTVLHPTIETEKFLAAFRSWVRRFLQLFGQLGRPLVLIIDDTQWLAADEVEIWRSVMDGASPLNHVIIIYMTRTNTPSPPVASTLLSASTIGLPVRRLTEEGVAAFINACLNGRVFSPGDAIVSFLYGETGGSPLFLRTLMTTLSKEHVVAFDYDSLQWRFDLVALQSHLSDASFDSYLENMMRRQPPEVREILKTMAYLPAAGFPLHLLAAAANMAVGEVENIVQLAVGNGTLSLRSNVVRFTHDRQRVAAQSLISDGDAGPMHKQVFEFLCRPDVKDDYLFEAMDHALIARKLGTEVAAIDVLTVLLLDATEQATLTANFSTAKHFIENAQHIVEETGGIEAWAVQYRPLCFRFVRLLTDIASVFHDHDSAFAQLEVMRPLCITSTEKIIVATLLIRQLIAANEHVLAVEMLMATLDEFGYNPENPKAVTHWEPSTAEDVEKLGADLLASEPALEDRNHVLIMSLISYAGPTIYITQTDRRYAIFKLGLSITKALGRIHNSASYIMAVQTITINDATIKKAFLQLSREICNRYPASHFTSCALILIAAQSHFFSTRAETAAAFDAAFEASISLADYEVAAYVIALDLSSLLFNTQPPSWEIVSRRYEMVKPYATSAHTIVTNAQIQYWENLARPNMPHPWEFCGPFFHTSDLTMTKGLKFQAGVADTIRLRLQLFYDAPRAVMLESLQSGRKTLAGTVGLPIGTEMRWVLAMVQLRAGEGTDLMDDCRRFLKQYTLYSKDISARYDMLRAAQLVHEDPLKHLAAIEKHIKDFDDGEQVVLSGLLNYFLADKLVDRTGSTTIAAGYIHAAFLRYRQSESYGLCKALQARFPEFCPEAIPNVRAPSEYFLDGILPPALRRVSVQTNSESMYSIQTNESASATTLPQSENNSGIAESEAPADANAGPSVNDSLDTLALMRSSLALAQEKDSLVLLCTLLRILCQFTRCDYAAIALNDEEDRATFRLKAAGPFQRIVSYDLDIADDAAVGICPATIMMHVARTAIPIRKPVTTSRLRNDQFYNDRQPRSLLCLPIRHQGVPSGVILLLSMNSASSTVQSESACEVVSTLATFAYIIHLHHMFTKRLKTEVAQRTRELTAALQAKTQFLSQCSHELRSPLAAIMGLAAVLEASQGLTPVQREHLQTINNSGNDLLALISNILDHSKLESNSVLLENIPFSVRDVVEGALDTIAPVAQSKNVELTAVSMFKNELPGLIGDPFRVKQVLLNLMSNAVKFTPPSDPATRRISRVTVDRSWDELDDDTIQVTLSVADTGVGILASKLHKLFRSFSQVDESITRSYGGSGLGLVISRDLARLLGGDCSVESEYGKGSKFTFTFVAKRDPNWRPTPLRKFETTRKAFIGTAPDMLWGRVLEVDLRGFNCDADLFPDTPEHGLTPGYPGGLADGKQYDFLFMDAPLLTRDDLQVIRKLQPNATFIFVSRATEISVIMERLDIPRESIIARPLKFQSLQDCLVPLPAGPVTKSGKTSKRNINRTLGKEKPLKILVVDDLGINIAVCTRILELFGYSDIDSAANGLLATEMAEKTRYDVIFLDLQMPVLDGFGALKRIKASPLAGEPCCVSLSANVDKATQTKCYEAGFFSVLHKPVDIPKLGLILNEVHEFRNRPKSRQPTPPATSPQTNGNAALPVVAASKPSATTAEN